MFTSETGYAHVALIGNNHQTYNMKILERYSEHYTCNLVYERNSSVVV